MALVIGAASAGAQTLTFSLIDAPCNNDGILGVNVTGLTPPLTISWQTSGSMPVTITHTVTGSSDALTGYSGGPVTVTAASASGSAFGAYAGAPPFTYTILSTTAACPSPGGLMATVSGGVPPYSYQWFKKPSNANIGTGNPISLPTGDYGVTITDAAGCKYGSKAAPDAGFVGYISPFSITLSATPAGCTNGTASVTASSAATLPVSYRWSNGATSQTITGLTAGQYAVTVTDALGCISGLPASTATMGFTDMVTVPQAYPISVPVTGTPATCAGNDGSVIAIPSGGVAPYSFRWSNGSTTQSQTGLPAAFYQVLVTDANGCTGTGNSTVSTPSPITVFASASPSLCTSPTGNATLTISGGTPPYSVLWYTTPAHATATATLLSAGTYSYKVTDAAGCTRTGSVTVPQVSNITTGFSATSATCLSATGSATVTPTGGVAPYTYSWSTGATAPSIAGIAPGTYSVTVTDNAGCKKTAAYTIPANSPVSLGLVSTPASCILSNDGAIIATPAGGSGPYAYGWSSGSSSASLVGLPYGPYWVNVTDVSGCTVRGYSYVSYDAANDACYCTVTGTIYRDTNNNCTQDAGDRGMANVQVHCSGIGYTYTDANGAYSFKVPSGTYTITETLPSWASLATCQANGVLIATTAGTGCVNTVNFANTSSTIHDIHISTWDYSRAVRGNIYHQVTFITNEGNVVEDSVAVSYKPDGQLFAPSFTPEGIFTGSSYWYNTVANFASIVPGATKAYYMSYNVPGNIAIGSTVNFKDTAAYIAPVSNWLSDNTPANNVSNFSTTIYGSFDPNFKQVSPRGTGTNGLISPNDSVIEYMVHFQNLGNWYAQNVIVVDTLDNNLDWTTMRPVYMSAPCQVTLKQAGAYKIATFTFNNIYLTPQSMDDARSQGAFTYTVETKPGLAAGTQFRNKASIYFDYNEPIVTNSTVNTIGTAVVNNVTTTEISAANTFTVYPNPAVSSFTAVVVSQRAGNADMAISDVTGKTIISKVVSLQIGRQNIGSDVSSLAPGVYFVTLNNNGTIQTQKLVIIK